MKLQEGWLTFFLLCLMMMVAAWGVALASWSQGLWAGWFTALLGVLAGLALAKSRFSGTQAALFAVVYGTFFVGFFICVSLEGTWHERSLELVTRLGTFVYKVIFGGTSRDALPFPVLVASIFWTIGVIAAWSVFRRGAMWPAVLPGGLALLINAYYYQGPAPLDAYLAVYLLLGLLLVGRVSLLLREREWNEARVGYSVESRLDFLRAGLVVAMAGVMIGWAGPELTASPTVASVWQRLTGPWSSVREQWMRLFASIRAYGQNVNDFYGDSLTLGGPARLSDAPILDVAVGPVDDVALQAGVILQPVRFYWRSMTYDEYVDGRWTANGFEFREYDPAKESGYRTPGYRLRRDLKATFTLFVGASSRLYLLPQPEWVNRPAVFGLIETLGGAVEVGSVRSRDILRQGEVYESVSSVSVADEQSLRLAGDLYPDWVIRRYLQLPPEITERTRRLAEQIVSDADAQTPYDKAQAITSWLRENITYQQDIEAPPPEVEPVDYLLFERREGYCNYYASAEIVLLRSLRIPARMAVGMAQGELDTSSGVYHVRERDAHAWPEVFFPGYGWVEFEPTTAQPLLVRPERPPQPAADNTPPEDNPVDRPDPLESGPDREQDDEGLTPGPEPLGLSYWLFVFRRTLVTIGIVLGACLVVALGGLALLMRAGLLGWESLGALGTRVLRWQGMPVPSLVAQAYLHLERAARWLGLSLSPAQTPGERAQALGASLPSARPAVEVITDQYTTERYSPHPADGAAARSAWLGIRWQVWREGARRFIRSWTEDDVARASRALKKNGR